MAALALAGLPAPAESQPRSAPTVLQAATLTSVSIPASVPALAAQGSGEAAPGPVSGAAVAEPYVEPGRVPKTPRKRARMTQPGTAAGAAWKPPRYSISGLATFYDNGTTAMRLPAGTVVRICGPGGCIQRTVTDYGPQKPERVIDLDRPDFFRICGCPSWSGTVKVTVAVY